MNEKTIIKSKTLETNIPIVIFSILAIVSAIIGLWWLNFYNNLPYQLMDYYSTQCITTMIISFIASALFIFSAILSNWMMKNCEILVSDKRVSGKILFGIKVDLPLNQISCVRQGLFKSLTVATSSGVIRLWLIENREDVFSEITKLLSQIQNSQNIVQHNETISSNAD